MGLDSLCEVVVGEGIGMCAWAVELLLRHLALWRLIALLALLRWTRHSYSRYSTDGLVVELLEQWWCGDLTLRSYGL